MRFFKYYTQSLVTNGFLLLSIIAITSLIAAIFSVTLRMAPVSEKTGSAIGYSIFIISIFSVANVWLLEESRRGVLVQWRMLGYSSLTVACSIWFAMWLLYGAALSMLQWLYVPMVGGVISLDILIERFVIAGAILAVCLLVVLVRATLKRHSAIVSFVAFPIVFPVVLMGAFSSGFSMLFIGALCVVTASALLAGGSILSHHE